MPEHQNPRQEYQAQQDPVGRARLEQSVDRALCRQARPSRVHFEKEQPWWPTHESPIGAAKTLRRGVARDITNHSHAGVTRPADNRWRISKQI
jgi:hypothetical protein